MSEPVHKGARRVVQAAIADDMGCTDLHCTVCRRRAGLILDALSAAGLGFTHPQVPVSDNPTERTP